MLKKLFFLCLVLIQSFSFFGQSQLDKAKEIHQRVLTLDSHTDTPLMLNRNGFDFGKRNDPQKRGGRIDLPRMEEGSLDAVFFAVFVGQGPRTVEGNLNAREKAMRIFDQVYTTMSLYPEKVEIARNVADAWRLKKEGKRAIFLGVENGYPIGKDLSMIELLYNRGARYITLAHTKNNDICDSSTDTLEHNGLSGFGKEVVQEMNRLGIMVDVSHISDRAFYDVLKTTTTPVIASHSNARAVCDHPRNLTDDMLLALKKNGGVVQVCVLSTYVKKQEINPDKENAINELRKQYNYFIGLNDEQTQQAHDAWDEIEKKYPVELATVSDLVDHIDYIVNTIGVDYVGIGTDFDGGGALKDCIDVSQIPNITAELFKRGYTEEEIGKIWGGNFLRVFGAVEKARVL
ncbi:MAG: membrane dipeptidase [Bacteroidetes bacterium HGW-Bacteroidetes-1]|jgi:membrane dipeptidase|nr:MAG: membrane dipeptidase [Bacteroidetes bacterium HGW-Bacteroidetes-1]